jgi:hypothetical protein
VISRRNRPDDGHSEGLDTLEGLCAVWVNITKASIDAECSAVISQRNRSESPTPMDTIVWSAYSR